MEISIQDIQDKFGTLSENLQLAIMTADIDGHVVEIGDINSLTVQQMGELSLDIHMVILGFIQTTEFEELVKNSLKIDAEKASKIVNEVTDKILRKIRENMMTPQSEKPVVPPPAEQEQKHEQEQQQEQAKTNPPAEPILVVPNAPMPPKIIHPILEQKLAGSFQMPKTETEYSLNNLSQNSQTKSAEPTPPDSTPKIDPYREIPE